MKVILTGNVRGLGKTGDMVTVKDGFARNYLLPRGLAMVATTGNVKTLDHQKRIVKDKMDKEVKAARTLADKISSLSLTMHRLAGEEDKLFGSVTARDIAEAISNEGVEVHSSDIQLEEPIKALGVYNIPVKLHSDIVVEVKIWVVAAS